MAPLRLDNIWRQARVTIPTLLGLSTYRILIVGIVGSKPSGGRNAIHRMGGHVFYHTRASIDMAIDDISNVEGECPGTDVCTFQEDLCSWVNGQNGVVDDFDWLRNSGSTPSYGTGPSVDHTLGTADGVYLYIEASNSYTKGQKAWLISEHYDKGAHCLAFWYHLFGQNMGALSVYTRIGTSKPQLEWT